MPEDSFDAYMHDVRQYGRLSKEEERELGLLIKKGREEGASEEDRKKATAAKEKLVDANLRLVLSIVKQELPSDMRGKDLNMDVIQDGNKGLMRAAELFDPDQPAGFATYASYWIKTEVKRSIEQAREIHLPKETRTSIYELQKKEEELSEKLGRMPSDEEIGKELGKSEEEILRLRAMMNGTNLFLDELTGENHDEPIVDRYVSESPGVDEGLDQEERMAMVRESLSVLSGTEREIVVRHYGLNGHEAESLAQIARSYSVSRERMRQRFQAAMFKIKKHWKERGGNE